MCNHTDSLPIEDQEPGSPSERPLRAPTEAAAPFSDATRAWLGEAYDEHRDLVAGMLKRGDIRPESAREMLHDVFLTAGERARDHEVPANTEAMLVTVTGFAICNHGRRRRRRPPMDDEAELDDMPGSRPDGDRRVHIGECERIVAQILAVMPPAAGELIRRIDLEELSHAEAAALLGRRVDLVKRQHARAVEKFEELAVQYFCAPPGFEE